MPGRKSPGVQVRQGRDRQRGLLKGADLERFGRLRRRRAGGLERFLVQARERGFGGLSQRIRVTRRGRRVEKVIGKGGERGPEGLAPVSVRGLGRLARAGRG